MRYWPDISFRYTNNEVPQKRRETVNLFPDVTDGGEDINFTKCTRVLRKFDSCPAEKSVTNISTMQNSSTVSRHCNTREPSWAEDFIDLTEFCQPSTIPIKMEDSMDERLTSPVSNSTVRNHGFDYGLEVNDLDNNLDDNLWSMPSPLGLHDELPDPISDWFATTKENNNNRSKDILSSRPQLPYDINDSLLNSRLVSVPNIFQYNKKTVNFITDDVTSPPLKPDTTFFHSEPILNEHRNPTLSENLMLSEPEISMRLPSTDSRFPDKTGESSYSLPSQNQFLDMKSDIPALSRITFSSDVSSCSIQSPSITQSNLNQEEKSPSPVMSLHRDSILRHRSKSSVVNNNSEILPTLVGKDSDFDLVSFVFDDNKPSVSFDVSSLQETKSVPDVKTDTKKIDIAGSPSHQPLNIKIEPRDETTSTADDDLDSSILLVQRKTKQEVEEDDRQRRANKRLRRYSNCSSEDLTQLESEKYRELRNKNNEASRRSRANRKSREVEMREYADKLETENRRLKVKAEEMETLVKTLRNCLMQLVLKRR